MCFSSCLPLCFVTFLLLNVTLLTLLSYATVIYFIIQCLSFCLRERVELHTAGDREYKSLASKRVSFIFDPHCHALFKLPVFFLSMTRNPWKIVPRISIIMTHLHTRERRHLSVHNIIYFALFTNHSFIIKLPNFWSMIHIWFNIVIFLFHSSIDIPVNPLKCPAIYS